jgi:cardiolipin synthase
MVFPTIGLLIFLLIGSPKLPKRRRDLQSTMDRIIAKEIKKTSKNPRLAKYINNSKINERIKPFVQLNSKLGGMPAFDGNKIELLSDYYGTFGKIIKDINKAKKYVHIEFYALVLDEETEPVFEAMQKAVARGIKVRVLFDSFGSRKYPHYRKMKKHLSDIGVEWYKMLPLGIPFKSFTRPDLRNHRKIIVIDGEVGYTGSQNMINQTYHRKDELFYQELFARVQGPIVLQLGAAFLTDWYSETKLLIDVNSYPRVDSTPQVKGKVLAQVLPSGPGYENDNNLKLFNGLMHAAKNKIVITNPYFVPDGSLMEAITTAAQRGVDVTMINSEAMDHAFVTHAQRSYYEELLKSGVKIYWHDWPVLLHSKYMTIDDDIAVIGSSNLDMRSFQLNLEVTLVCYDKQIVKSLRQIEAKCLKHSRQLNLKSWRARPRRSKMLDDLARITAAVQ